MSPLGQTVIWGAWVIVVFEIIAALLALWTILSLSRKGHLKNVDAHRMVAHSQIDIDLGKNEITPREALRRKRQWDKQHGY